MCAEQLHITIRQGERREIHWAGDWPSTDLSRPTASHPTSEIIARKDQRQFQIVNRESNSTVKSDCQLYCKVNNENKWMALVGISQQGGRLVGSIQLYSRDKSSVGWLRIFGSFPYCLFRSTCNLMDRSTSSTQNLLYWFDPILDTVLIDGLLRSKDPSI